MFELGQSLPKRAVRATSAFPPTATGPRTSRTGSFAHRTGSRQCQLIGGNELRGTVELSHR